MINFFDARAFSKKPVIVDCVIFRDELDLLELRCEELGDVVDYFVVVESVRTWSGSEKPLILAKHMERFAPWVSKIIYYVDSSIPERATEDTVEARMVLESHQRDCIARALKTLDLKSDDIIMISDVDELPRREYVKELPNVVKGGQCVTFVQRMYISYINNTSDQRFNLLPWAGTVACHFSVLKHFTPTQIRFDRSRPDKHRAGLVIYHFRFDGEVYIEDGGWHFTYFGGMELEKYKMSTLVENAGAIANQPFVERAPSRHNYQDWREANPNYSQYFTESGVKLIPMSLDGVASFGDLPHSIVQNPLKYERFFFLENPIG